MTLGAEQAPDFLSHPLTVVVAGVVGAAVVAAIVKGITALIRFFRWATHVLSAVEHNILPWFRAPSGPGEKDQTMPTEMASIRREQGVQDGRLDRIEGHLGLEHPLDPYEGEGR